MSLLDGDDGKPFLYVRAILTQELYRKVGEFFGQHILEQETKGDVIMSMLTKMFDTTPTGDMSQEIVELAEALKLLAAQSKKEDTTDAGTTKES